MFALPLGALVFWWNFEAALPYLDVAQSGVLQLSTIQDWQIFVAGLFSISMALLFTVCLWHLRKVFNNFKRGRFFTEQNIHSLSMVSKVLFFSAIMQCVSSAVLSVILTWNNGPGEKALIVSIGLNEFWLFFIAATFLAIVWSFKEGRKIEQENAEFV